MKPKNEKWMPRPKGFYDAISEVLKQPMDGIKSFNDVHPELRAGEFFYSNILIEKLEEKFKRPPFRVGKQAYDRNGNAYSGSVPVFKKKAEKE